VTTRDLVMAVVRQVIKEFDLSLDELHNDSTTVTFCGTRQPSKKIDCVDDPLTPLPGATIRITGPT